MDAANNDAAERMLITVREIDAPREAVFDAWTKPEHLARWWGPDGFSTTTHAFEMKKGGHWRFTMHGPDGRDYQNLVTYEEIARPERIVYRHGGEGDTEHVQFRNTVTFEDLGGRTRLTLAAEFESKAARDRVVKEHHADEGGVQTLGRLADYIGEDIFVIARTLDAPRALVWKVWTETEHLERWWGPKGFGCTVHKLELRPGGVLHYAMQTPQGPEMWGKFVYREIVAPERMVYVNCFSDKDGNITRAPFAADWPLEVLNVMTLAEENGKTVLTVKSRPINASEAEHAKFKSWHASMRGGFGGTFEQLANYLADVKG